MALKVYAENVAEQVTAPDRLRLPTAHRFTEISCLRFVIFTHRQLSYTFSNK